MVSENRKAPSADSRRRAQNMVEMSIDRMRGAFLVWTESSRMRKLPLEQRAALFVSDVSFSPAVCRILGFGQWLCRGSVSQAQLAVKAFHPYRKEAHAWLTETQGVPQIATCELCRHRV